MPVASDKGTFEPAPAGTHIARCIGCISLGTQHSENFADSFKVMLLFELPFELVNMGDRGEMPATVHNEYTLSLNTKATLRQHLDSWRGDPFTKEELEGFEISKVVGAPCQVAIKHKLSGSGKVYAKITAITGLAKGMTCPDQAHKSTKFEIEDGRSPAFSCLPDWIKAKIEACSEWQATTAAAPQAKQPDTLPPEPEGEEDSEIPF